eukprot:scpid12511/ scgid8494/ 
MKLGSTNDTLITASVPMNRTRYLSKRLTLGGSGGGGGAPPLPLLPEDDEDDEEDDDGDDDDAVEELGAGCGAGAPEGPLLFVATRCGAGAVGGASPGDLGPVPAEEGGTGGEVELANRTHEIDTGLPALAKRGMYWERARKDMSASIFETLPSRKMEQYEFQ